MLSIKKSAAIAAVTMSLLFGGGSTLAFSNGGGNSADAPGQANARANCSEVIFKQNANGQTGAQTGSANDSKQPDTAVTNCDGFFN